MRIASTDRYAAEIKQRAHAQMTQRFTWKNLLKARRKKNHGCGPTGPRKLHYEQPGYRVFSRTSRDIQHTQQVANRQQQQQPQEARLQQSRNITVSVPFNNQKTALRPQLQTAPNLADKQTYVFPTISQKISSIGHRLPAQTIRLPKLSVLKLQQSELTKPLSNRMLHCPKSQTS